MVKQNRGFEHEKEDDHGNWAHANKEDREQEKGDRKKHFTKMKPGSSAHIHVEIGVMDVMKPPKERDPVIGPMPPPVSVVHQDESGGGRAR